MQVVAVPVVDGGTEQIREPPMTAAEVRERKPDITLALVGRIINIYQQAFPTGSFPGTRQEAVAGPVSVPRGPAFEELPKALSQGRFAQGGQEAGVELSQSSIYRFLGGPA